MVIFLSCNQGFEVNGIKVKARVYYADSAAFKGKLAFYIPEPTSYEDSPFYPIKSWHALNQNQGFAYYTYGDGGSIKEFTYVNKDKVYQTTDGGKIPSLTVAEIKNRCIPCVYWGTAIFVVVIKYSNLFCSFAFFLDRSHFAFGYELIISSEAAGFMKIICNSFTLI